MSPNKKRRNKSETLFRRVHDWRCFAGRRFCPSPMLSHGSWRPAVAIKGKI
jgi:hypothetical protein